MGARIGLISETDEGMAHRAILAADPPPVWSGLRQLPTLRAIDPPANNDGDRSASDANNAV